MRRAGFVIILFRSVLAAAVIGLFGSAALAQKAGCPTSLGDRADSAEDRISTWEGLFAWYREYGACDDGETAEGIDDVAAKLFNGQWDRLMRDAAVVERNAGLRRFLLRHIDVVGTSAEQARALERRARSACPAANFNLCRDIAREAAATVTEATQ